MKSLPVPRGLVEHPNRSGVADGALGLVGGRPVPAVDAPDSNSSDADCLHERSERCTRLDVGLGGGEHLELRAHEAHQRGEVGCVRGRVEGKAPSSGKHLGFSIVNVALGTGRHNGGSVTPIGGHRGVLIVQF